MNKGTLISAVAEKSGLSKRDAEKAVNAVLDAVTDALAAGDKVQLVNFGSFDVRERKERIGRNPQTGESTKIPASRVPVFRAGASLKQAVAK